MNRSRHLLSATACILAVLLVTGTAGPGALAIACICPDGQVTVEAADCACCGPETSGDQSGPAALASEQPSCNDCVDVALHTSPIKAGSIQLNHATVVAGRHGSPTVPAVDCERSRSAPPDLGHRLSLALLSSVVILT